MSDQATRHALSRPRPARIAFFVDRNEVSHRELDGIFTACGGLWGGRFSLIVPCVDREPLPEFLEWLETYDADFLYSYVDFADRTVHALHERFYPSVLVKHHVEQDRHDVYAKRPTLPLVPLSVRTVLPLASGTSFGRPLEAIGLVDTWDEALSAGFLRDTFGAATECLGQSLPRAYAAFAHEVRVATPGGVGAVRSGPDVEVVPSLVALTQRLTGDPKVSGALQLAASYAPRFMVRRHPWSSTFSLVVGDTFDDRLMHWNARYLWPSERAGDLVCARLPRAAFDDAEFIAAFSLLLRERNRVYGERGEEPSVVLRSMSIPQAELENLAPHLRIPPPRHLTVEARHVPSYADWIPTTPQLAEAYFEGDQTWRGAARPAWTETAYSNRELRLTVPHPSHLASVPADLRESSTGTWAVDIDLERVVDNSPYSNVVHRWTLPRRLRMAGAFVKRYALFEGGGLTGTARVSRRGYLVAFSAAHTRLPLIQLPDDEAAVRFALTQGADWSAFDPLRQEPQQAVQQCRVAIASSHGRYFRGTYAFFRELNYARHVLMHAYWFEQFGTMGASSRRTPAIEERVSNRLKKQFRNGSVDLRNAAELHRATEIVLQEAESLRATPYDLSWSSLDERFRALQEREGLTADKVIGTTLEEWLESQRDAFVAAVQDLCQREILHQGQRYTCQKCLNKIWIAIDNMRRSIVCPVCGNESPASVNREWHFRLNAFVAASLRDYGAWPLFWVLSRLQRHSDESFYFVGPLEIYLNEENARDKKPATDLDLVIVQGGRVRMVEAKQSVRKLDSVQFANTVLKLRPDIATLAVMEPENNEILQRFAEFSNALADSGIRPELLTFDAATDLEGKAWL